MSDPWAKILNQFPYVKIMELETGDFGDTTSLAAFPNKPPKFAYTSANTWVQSYGRHVPVYIRNCKVGDVVDLTLVGSAGDSDFHYHIEELSGNAKSGFPSSQIIQNTGSRWMSITTKAVYEVISAGDLLFVANIVKGEALGKVQIYRLGLVAIVHS